MVTDDDTERMDEVRRRLEEARTIYDSLRSADRKLVETIATQTHYDISIVMSSLISDGSDLAGGAFRGLRIRMSAVRRLDLRALTELRTVVVEHVGSLREVDVRGLVKLETLELIWCEKLTRLRLGANVGLRRLGCSDSRVVELSLGETPELRELDCSQTRVRELYLPERLEALDCSQTRLESLTLAQSLRFLRCGANRLRELALNTAPRLTVLDASGNRLRKLDTSPCPRLAFLDIAGNRLRKLDISHNRRLITLGAGQNRITDLDLSKQCRLVKLEVNDNLLTELDLDGCPLLEQLDCSGNHLKRLVLRHDHLRSLDLANNALSILDLSNVRALVDLALGGNPLHSVDLTPCWQLVELDRGDDDIARRVPRRCIVATHEQRRRLPALDLVPWNMAWFPVLSWMGPYQLHRWMLDYNWDSGLELLNDAVEHARCDLGTALAIYWMNAPGYLAQFDSRDSAPDYLHDSWALMVKIEQRVREDRYKTALIPYDPYYCAVGIDRTRLYLGPVVRRPIPSYMCRRSVDGPTPRVHATRLPSQLGLMPGWRAFRAGRPRCFTDELF